MPDSVTAVAVFVVAVLPGALYTWAFEREAGRWGIGFSDRVLRFVGTSVIFHFLYAVPLYLADSAYVPHRLLLEGTAYFESQLDDEPRLHVLTAAAAYVSIPIIAGLVVGSGVRAEAGWRRRLSGALVGRAPAPRSWDAVFAPRPAAIVRGRLKVSQAWVAGLFGDDSYAAGYPEEPQDLFLEVAYRIAADGELERDADDQPIPVGSSLLVRADELEFIEIFPLE